MTADMTRLDRGSALATATAKPRRRHAGTGLVHGQLAATIENQIVPRLVARCGTAAAAPGEAVDGQEVLDLAAFAIAHDGEATRHHLLGSASGRSFEQVCFDLLGPAARHLGDLWVEDLCSFTDVTLGVMRLQHAFHGLSGFVRSVVPEGFRRRRILLAPVPGEQHTFGLSMVSAFFARAGWQVTALAGVSADALVAQAQADWFAVVGLSAGSEVRSEMLSGFIERLRRTARNPAMGIMVGGPVFTLQPDLAWQIGADGTAADGLQATWLAENLLGGRTAVR